MVIQIKKVQDDGRVFIDMAGGEENPCQDCGACCSHFRVSFYMGELSGGTGGWVPVEMTSKVNDFHACMKGTESGSGRCIALKGEIGQSGIRCGVYENRPSPCREYPVWMEDGSPNPDCQRLRGARGIPLLSFKK